MWCSSLHQLSERRCRQQKKGEKKEERKIKLAKEKTKGKDKIKRKKWKKKKKKEIKRLFKANRIAQNQHFKTSHRGKG